MNAQYACCSFRGSIVVLQASTGKLLWKSYTIAQEPKEDRDQQRRRPPERAIGRRGLVGADLRRREKCDLCDNRLQLLRYPHRYFGRGPGVRRRVGRFAVVAADDDRRRLQHGLQRDRGSGIAPSARDRIMISAPRRSSPIFPMESVSSSPRRNRAS